MELHDVLIKVSSLYKKYGIKSVTMDDVAREMGISKKTLYQFVSDKADLVEKVITHELDNSCCDFDEFHEKAVNAIEQLLMVHGEMLKMIREHKPSMDFDLKKYYPELHGKAAQFKRDKLYDAIIDNLERGKKEGLIREKINANIIARLTISRMDYLHDALLFPPHEIAMPEFFTEIFEYHIRGIATDKGIKLFEEKFNNNLK